MITLKTLHKATAREVFNQVKLHMLTQAEKCMADGGCTYRNDQGLKCAAGCLIADEEYDPKMENNNWIDMVEEGLVTGTHSLLIQKLQNTHDGYSADDWEEVLARIEGVFR